MVKSIKEKTKEFSEMINKYPNVKEFYIERAKLYDASRQYKKAVEDFKKAYLEYYVCQDIVTVCEDLELNKEAEKFYTKAINENRNNVYNYFKRLHFYIRTGETEKAISDCKTILELSPEDETILTLKKILTQ